MTESYKSRKKMVRDNFIGFDATNLTYDEIIKTIKTIGYKRFEFKTVATSYGVYGINGIIINVMTKTDNPEVITSFSILSRSMTILEFI